MVYDKDGALKRTLYITQGADWNLTFPINDPVTGLPLDISTWSLKGQIRESNESAAILHTWDSANASATVGIAGAKILVPAATSLAWTWCDLSALYDLFLTSASGKIACIARGPVVIRTATTR